MDQKENIKGVFNTKYDIFVDPTSAEDLIVGYKGSDHFTIPEGKTEFGPGADWSHRPCLNCGGAMNQAECPDKKKDEEEDIHGRCLVAHGWCCSKCGGSKVDDVAFEKSMSRADYEPKDAGFFYCPYDPEFLKSIKGFDFPDEW